MRKNSKLINPCAEDLPVHFFSLQEAARSYPRLYPIVWQLPPSLPLPVRPRSRRPTTLVGMEGRGRGRQLFSFFFFLLFLHSFIGSRDRGTCIEHCIFWHGTRVRTSNSSPWWTPNPAHAPRIILNSKEHPRGEEHARTFCAPVARRGGGGWFCRFST